MLNILNKIGVPYLLIAIQILLLSIVYAYKSFSIVFLIFIVLIIFLVIILFFIIMNNINKHSSKFKNFKIHYYILYFAEAAIILTGPYFFNV